MIKAIWSFIKALGASVNKNTIAPIKRWVVNSKDGKADEIDKRTASRVLTYLGLAVFAYWFPQAVMIVIVLRNIVFGDIIGVLGSIVVDTLNLFAVRSAQTAA